MKRQSLFAETADRLKKPRPRLLDKRERAAKVGAEDRAENAKVKARSRGECEVRELFPNALTRATYICRCHRRAGHIHHLRSGIGIRNRGDSIKAKCKLHVCELHHEEIHSHVLKPVNELDRYDAATVRYERVK